MDINSLLSPDSNPPATQNPTNPGMDTLADLAAMQHHQPHRPNAPSLLRSTESYEHQLSPSPINPHSNQAVNHNTPTPRTSFDIAMSDVPQESAQRNYVQTSLEPEAQQKATILFTEIQKNPHSYDAHVQFIGVLHAGFMNHVYPPNDPDMHGDPRLYDLLKDMRTAREEMDKLFAMGEDLWAEWLQDESMLAHSLDECIAVMDLCKRSVEEEYGSTKLWIVYGEWVLHIYEAGPEKWTEAERTKAREVFNIQTVLQVWQAAAEATKWRINDSHLVWDRLLDLYIRHFGPSPSPRENDQLLKFYQARLQIPHATWEETFIKFEEFIDVNYQRNCKRLVSSILHDQRVRNCYASRAPFESRLSYAQACQDKTLEREVWSEYLLMEARQKRSKLELETAFALLNSLYQRALLRFPVDVSLWEDLVMFLVDQSLHHANRPILATLDRATRHCPWSGDLWSQYLLSFEREERSFTEIAGIKHKATSTGLLDVGGIEEVLKVQAAWCGYLRRRAFLPDSLDEDMDVASVGIVSAKESLTELGTKIYGAAYQGDPLFRLERIHIRFLSESGSWDSAREIFKSLIAHRGTSYEFWLTYYQWEISAWSKFIQVEATADVSRRTSNPSYATAVLKQASKRKDLDWPEKIMQAYIAHCQDYEDTEELQIACILTRRTMKAVNAQRAQAHEAAVAAAASAAQFAPPADKRKRLTEDNNGEPDGKKARSDEPVSAVEIEPVAPASVEPVRDREGSTILMTNLPPDVTETKISEFFHLVSWDECRDVKIFPPDEDENETRATAVVEFCNKSAAVSAATRDMKPFNPRHKQRDIVRVYQDTGLLWVSNFVDAADEQYMRNLFKKYGKIVDVRFPSLAKHIHRKFCYVQLLTLKEATAALELNGMMIDGKLLIVKISAPPLDKNTKKVQDIEARALKKDIGSRELYCNNLAYSWTDQDLIDAFAKFGTVETAWVAKDHNGRNKGWGKVRFATKEEATSGLALDGVEVGPRRIHCELVKERGGDGDKLRKEISPDEENRTIAVLNLPDTVNRERIAALFEPYGELVKVERHFQHGGAFVVFSNVADSGKARLALSGTNFSGVTLQFGTVKEMKRQGPSGAEVEPPAALAAAGHNA
ncbi:hypothetical protein N7495_008586 [Penicillium taxi]|uniref:uncharacterized protein n=1 Tax=Penicillium taxi TaxID=168475 RepID=UPI002544F8D0|nr:uncharacterized protein N7495_008586 [Penicillium taxi]KAJ5888545.1 hypothetical protein N7495_008586 [Penicillium taxi]